MRNSTPTFIVILKLMAPLFRGLFVLGVMAGLANAILSLPEQNIYTLSIGLFLNAVGLYFLFQSARKCWDVDAPDEPGRNKMFEPKQHFLK